MANKPTYKDLEKKVRKLQKEVIERKRTEEALRRRQDAFKAKAIELKEVNTGLRILLEARNKDKSELGEKMLSNVKELVAPYIDKLKRSRLDTKQMTYLKILQCNLNNVVSPFVHRLSSKYSVLTPTEIQVAQLVREGKTTREIGELLNSSKRTIESHRQNIRVKLGLKDTKANLRSHLSLV